MWAHETLGSTAGKHFMHCKEYGDQLKSDRLNLKHTPQGQSRHDTCHGAMTRHGNLPIIIRSKIKRATRFERIKTSVLSLHHCHLDCFGG